MDLKQSIKSLTGVLPERQKLLGLKVKGNSRPQLEPEPSHQCLCWNFMLIQHCVCVCVCVCVRENSTHQLPVT